MKVILPEDVKTIDRKAEEEYLIPTLLLMEHAASALASAAGKIEGDVLVVCGSGGNGGDGFAAARMLYQRERHVDILFPFNDESLFGNTKLNRGIAQRLGIPIFYSLDDIDLSKYSLVIDALFGTGLARNVEGSLALIIEEINACNAYKICADIPSGINGADGHVRGCAIKADETVAFGFEKPGLLLFPGREHAGRITVADIGVPAKLIANANMHHYTPYEIAQMLPKRAQNSHKGHYGHVLVLAGSRGFMGAGGLCARGAVIGGAGLVTWAYPAGEDANPPLEAMTCPLTAKEGKIDAKAAHNTLGELFENKSCIAVGPGLCVEAAYNLVKLLLEFDKPMVIDADAINALALFDALPRFNAPCIITPHPGEMARVLHKETSVVIDHPVQSAKELADQANAVVILKMATSVIAAPGGKICFNTTGNPGMATGGSGDVLTGICAAMLARGADPYEAASCAAYLHGVAGDMAAKKCGEDSMGSSDIANCVAESYNSLLKYQIT